MGAKLGGSGSDEPISDINIVPFVDIILVVLIIFMVTTPIIMKPSINTGGHGYVSRDFAHFSPLGDDGLVELGRTVYQTPQPDSLFIHWRGGNPGAARPVLWEARSDGWIPMKAGYSLFGYNSESPGDLGAETINHPFGAEVTFVERIRQAED